MSNNSLQSSDMFWQFTSNVSGESGDFFRVKFEELADSRQGPLTIKWGCDPTSPVLHLGHCIMLERLKFLQNEGHNIVVIIGSFTAMVGDPTDKKSERIRMTREEVSLCCKNYKEYIGRVLDLEKTEFKFNDQWLSAMNLEDIAEVLSHVTISQLLQRRDFKLRMKAGLRMHEVIYPILQAYDSVVLDADVELGGSDQLFNLCAGRDLQKSMNQSPQMIMLTDLMTGADGRKMSKSFNNYVAIDDDKMFAKLMSVSDKTMFEYMNQLLIPLCILKSRYGISKDPRGPELKNLKKAFAHFITCRYMGNEEANAQAEKYRQAFESNELSPEIFKIINLNLECINAIDLIEQLKVISSRSQIKRVITQGGVQIDGVALKNYEFQVSNKEFIISIGKLTKIKIVAK